MTDQNRPIITPEKERAWLDRPELKRVFVLMNRHPIATAGIIALLFVWLVSLFDTSGPSPLIPVLLIGGIGMFIYFARRGREIRQAESPESAIQKWQSQPYEGSQVIIKTYEGSQVEAMRRFQADAIRMAAEDCFPTSQSWAPGQWSGGAFAVAILLILLFGLGILILGYMLIVKPDGTLTVTYERRTHPSEEKTCPKCAERIKAQALVCHFCGYEFPPLRPPPLPL